LSVATIRDVAKASNVSIATVSRVFNDSPLVTVETRARVVEAAQKLGYWPNGIARSLITNRTNTLGAMLPDLHGEFFSEVIHGIDLAARERGYHLLVSRTSSNPQELTSVLRSMRGRVDGLLVMAPDIDAETLRALAGNVPSVLLNADTAIPGLRAIAIANREGADAVVRHLCGLGHKRIATITGPGKNLDARERLEGYRDALRAFEIEPLPELEYAGDFTERSGYTAAEKLLRAEPRPSAVFVANDYMAVGALSAFHAAGVHVPSDMAVAGFDDIPLARFLTPPLTTVHVDMLRLGQRAVQLLLEPIGGGIEEFVRERVPTTLVVRKSCGVAWPDQEGPAGWNRGNTGSGR
jgi:LacI family transcriptional regulator